MKNLLFSAVCVLVLGLCLSVHTNMRQAANIAPVEPIIPISELVAVPDNEISQGQTAVGLPLAIYVCENLEGPEFYTTCQNKTIDDSVIACICYDNSTCVTGVADECACKNVPSITNYTTGTACAGQEPEEEAHEEETSETSNQIETAVGPALEIYVCEDLRRIGAPASCQNGTTNNVAAACICYDDGICLSGNTDECACYSTPNIANYTTGTSCAVSDQTETAVGPALSIYVCENLEGDEFYTTCQNKTIDDSVVACICYDNGTCSTGVADECACRSTPNIANYTTGTACADNTQ